MDIEEKLDLLWRMRCPEGHSSLQEDSSAGETVYCDSCLESYPHEELLDATEDAVPDPRE